MAVFVLSVLFVPSSFALAANESLLTSLAVTADDEGNTTVTWQTVGDTVGHIDLTSVDGRYTKSVESAPVGNATDHAVVFPKVPADTDLDLTVEAIDGENNSTRLGARFRLDEAIGHDLVLLGSSGPDPRLTPAAPKTNSSGTRSTSGPTSTATATAGAGQVPNGFDGPAMGDTTPLQEFMNLPLWTAGERIVHLFDGLWWLTLVLAALATVLEVYFFLQRRRLWGVVYDARTKESVEMAVVRLFDQEHHKLLETRVTGRNGRFSFLGEKGEYYLEVTKEGYHFPSRIVTVTSDQQYTNVYRGEVIKLIPGQSLIAPDIPIDSESGEVKAASAWRRWLFPLLDSLRLPLLLFALVAANLVEFIVEPPPNFSVQVVILLWLMLFLELAFTRRGRK